MFEDKFAKSVGVTDEDHCYVSKYLRRPTAENRNGACFVLESRCTKELLKQRYIEYPGSSGTFLRG